MLTFSLASYLFSGSVCLTVGIMLLSVGKDMTANDRKFRIVKNLLAYSAFLDVIVDAVVIYFQVNGLNWFLLDYFFIPSIYYIQLILISFSLLQFVHSALFSFRRMLLTMLPAVLLLAAELTAYFSGSGWILSQDAFIEYSLTNTGIALRTVLYCIIFVLLAGSIIVLLRETVKYRRTLSEFFSDADRIRTGRQLSYMVFAFIIYFILACTDFFFSNPAADPVYMIFNTVIFIIYSIVIMNLKDVYSSVEPASTLMQDRPSASYEAMGPLSTIAYNKAQVEMKTLIEKWMTSSDHPFTKDSITINDVSEAIGVRPRLLSEYINRIYNTNFSSWINNMRIEYAQELLQKASSNPDSQMNISQIAYESGFSSPVTFSRVFKKITGKTPTEARNI